MKKLFMLFIHLCKVKTSSGKLCQFPFTYSGSSYSTCIVNGPNNPNNLPQCITANGQWDWCQGKNLLSYFNSHKVSLNYIDFKTVERM